MNKYARIGAAVALCAAVGCSRQEPPEADAKDVAAAAIAGFTTDYDGALKRAAERGVGTLVLFTGSDWCVWCQRLEKEVLSKPEFLAKAKERYELVYCDFPAEKELPKKLADRNKKLAEKYHVSGYPTVIALDKDGRVAATLGYKDGGPEKWLEYAEKESALAGAVAKHLKAFDEEFNKLDNEAFAIFEKARKAVESETDKDKRKQTLNGLFAEPLAKMKDFEKRLSAAEMPEELADKKADLVEAAKHVIFALENED